jgi:hypothetical protein
MRITCLVTSLFLLTMVNSLAPAQEPAPRFVYMGERVMESAALRVEPGSVKEGALAGVLGRWLFKSQVSSRFAQNTTNDHTRPYVEGMAAALLRHLRPGLHQESLLELLSDFAHVSPEVLGLSEPIEVVSATMFWDGGSQFLELKDSSGRTLQVLIPARMKSVQRLTRR